MKKLVFLAVILISVFSFSQKITVTKGKLNVIENFPSNFVDSRTIAIWTPENYSIESYAVLYMHDGQMLFDASTTWNKQAWEMDETAGILIEANILKKFIIVAIWNNNQKRHAEYFPQKAFDLLSIDEQKYVSNILRESGRTNETFQPVSDNYLKFITQELKPYIDKNYATYKDKENTFIAGSSMGGLISLYAICEYPEVFGGAICMSTHWPGIFSVESNPVPKTFYSYLRKSLPNPENHKIYFDYGDQTLDALYAPFQKEVDKIMIEKGFTSSNWVTKFFPGEDHSENAWRNRVSIPLQIMLKK